MKKIFLIVLLCVSASTVKAQLLSQSRPLVIGEYQSVRSKVLGEDRTLLVYLPYGYDKMKSYPVIYLLDGSINEDFIHIVGIAQFFKLMYGMPEFIVVGIANIDRKKDFTSPTGNKTMQKDFPTAGNSEKFIGFIESEVQPFIKEKYNTTETKYLIGQSLGGLLAAEILLKKPEMFSHYFIVSPSLWWDDSSLLKKTKDLLEQHPEQKKYVYVAVGDREPAVMQQDAKSFEEKLRKSGRSGLKTDFVLLKGETHGTILHQAIIEGFKKLGN